MKTLAPLLIILTAIGIIFSIGFQIKLRTYKKNDVILTQNNKDIIVKHYKTHVSLNEDFKKFNVKIDSTILRHSPNKILYNGIVVRTNHRPHVVIVKTNNGLKDVSEYFSCSQIEDIESHIGKKIIITKTYYPENRIFYKFQ